MLITIHYLNWATDAMNFYNVSNMKAITDDELPETLKLKRKCSTSFMATENYIFHQDFYTQKTFVMRKDAGKIGLEGIRHILASTPEYKRLEPGDVIEINERKYVALAQGFALMKEENETLLDII